MFPPFCRYAPPHSHSIPSHPPSFSIPFFPEKKKTRKNTSPPLDRLSLPSHYKHSSNETKSEIETTKKRATTTRPSRSAPSTLLNIRFNISLTPLAYLYHRRTKKKPTPEAPALVFFLFQVIPPLSLSNPSPPVAPFMPYFFFLATPSRKTALVRNSTKTLGSVAFASKTKTTRCPVQFQKLRTKRGGARFPNPATTK